MNSVVDRAAFREDATGVMGISPTIEIVELLRAGAMAILVDEEHRENEGDLVLAADHVTPDAINFMAKWGRGLVCVTLPEERCRELELPLMTARGHRGEGTNFTVSVDAAQGVTTGISSSDRAHTIRTLVDRNAGPGDLARPGHVFPLAARPGGVLVRSGHTEAGCDLASLAGLTPAAVICEIMKDDGTMARLPDLIQFAERHQLKIGTIADLIRFRSRSERIVERIHQRRMRTPYGEFDAHLYRDKPSASVHLALVKGTPTPEEETLVRVYGPLTGLNLLDLSVPERTWSIPASLAAISDSGRGVAVLLNCSPNPEHFVEKFTGFAADGAPTRFRPDDRIYGVGAQILKDLGVGKIRLLASPLKLPALAGHGLDLVAFEQPPG